MDLLFLDLFVSEIGIYSNGFHPTLVFENRYKIIIFQLIIIFQQFQVV